MYVLVLFVIMVAMLIITVPLLTFLTLKVITLSKQVSQLSSSMVSQMVGSGAFDLSNFTKKDKKGGDDKKSDGKNVLVG